MATAEQERPAMLAVEFNQRTALINLDHIRGGGANFARTCAEAFGIEEGAIAGVKRGGTTTVYPPSYVAFRKDKFADSACPLVFKFTTPNFMSRGADISWLSVFPDEKETLYPPLTYLRFLGTSTESVDGKAMRVTTVEPQFPS